LTPAGPRDTLRLLFSEYFSEHSTQQQVGGDMISRLGTIDKLLLVMAAFLCPLLATQQNSAADKIRIAYTSPGPQHGVLWVGDVAGVFKKNNLDLEIIYMPGNISMGSLISGELNFGQMTGALMSPARLQGSDVVMLVSIQELLDDRFVVRPNIKTPEELKGKRIAVSRSAPPRICACSICCRASD
jgi:ABC-type nitrate/sulfonate/bicarbonate transport system substrate-binding protein